MKKALGLIAVLLTGVFALQAQSRTVTGTVKDKQGAALAGVSVTVKGTSVSAATDAAGAYSIVIPEKGKILEFRLAGYKKNNQGVGKKNEISIGMKPDKSPKNKKKEGKGKQEDAGKGKCKGKSGVDDDDTPGGKGKDKD